MSPSADKIKIPVELTAYRQFLSAAVGQRNLPAPQQAKFQFELGRYFEFIDRDNERALSHYEAAILVDSTWVPALRACRRHYAAHQRWSDCRTILERELASQISPRTRALLLTELGELCWRCFGDTDRAEQFLRRALATAPWLRRAGELLNVLFVNQSRWGDLRFVIGQCAQHTEDSRERAVLYAEMAEITFYHFAEPMRAEILGEQSLTHDADQPRAPALLRHLYLKHQRWAACAKLLVDQARRHDDLTQSFRNLYAAARITDLCVQDTSTARALLKEASDLRPLEALPWIVHSGLVRRNGQSEEEVLLLGHLVVLLQSPELRAVVFQRQGALLEKLGRIPDAISAYTVGLQEHSGDLLCRRSLLRLHRHGGQWSAMLALLQSLVPLYTDVRTKAWIQGEVARLHERHSLNFDQAREAYEQALDLDPRQLAPLFALHRLYRKAGRFDLIRALYERRAGITNDDSWSAAFLRLSLRPEGFVSRAPEHAIGPLEATLRHHPGDPEVLLQLIQLYEELDLPEEQFRVLEIAATMIVDKIERAEVWRELARLSVGVLRRPADSLAFLQRILLAIPEDSLAIWQLGDLVEELRLTSDVWGHLTQTAEKAIHAAERGTYYAMLAEYAAEEIYDFDRAKAAFTTALAADASPAIDLRILLRLLAFPQHWSEFLGELGKRAARRAVSSDNAIFLSLVGEMHEFVAAELDAAQRCYVLALSHHASPILAQDGLERALLRQCSPENTSVLNDLIRRRADGQRAPRSRIRALFERLEFLNWIDDKSDERNQVMGQILEIDAQQLDVLRCFRSTPYFARYAAEVGDRESVVATLLEWAAEIEQSHADKWDPSPIYEQILSIDPHHCTAACARERLACARGDFQLLFDIFSDLLPRQEQSVAAELVGSPLASSYLLLAMLALSAGDRRAAERLSKRGLVHDEAYLPLLRFARLLAEQDGDLARGASLFIAEARHCGGAWFQLSEEGVSQYQGFSEVLEVAASVLERQGDAARAVLIWEALAQRGEPVERVRMLVRLAHLYRDGLRDTDQSIAAIGQATMIALESGEGIEQLVDYYQHRNEFQQLAMAFGDILDMTESRGLQPRGAAALREARARALESR